jgi:hypothetical protein
MLWYNQVKEEEKCLDNEMALNPTLSLFISFNSVSQLFITSKPSKISPFLSRNWLKTTAGQFTEIVG